MSYDMDDKSGDAVRVMTRGETEDYSGVTLEAEGNPKLDDEKKDSEKLIEDLKKEDFSMFAYTCYDDVIMCMW